MTIAACHAATRTKRVAPSCELADVFRRYGDAYRRTHRLPLWHLKVMHAIESCRTPALGGHRESCAQCGFVRYTFHSCRNRHCPKCQALTKAQWLEARQAELLPVPHFHNVFTLPHQLNPIILCDDRNKRELLNLLFSAASQTLLEFGRNNLGGKLGFTMVLHTWDQRLGAHFHVHCVIAGGALDVQNGRWIASGSKFLFPVHALSRVFRAKFLEGLKALHEQDKLVFPGQLGQLATAKSFQSFVDQLWQIPWVAYSKRPFGGPKQVLDYLGRYTHRVAISNERILSEADGKVTFRYRDRADGDQTKIATYEAEKFIRRFLLHILPSGFMRIRHFGFLANCVKKSSLAVCREHLGIGESQRDAEQKTTIEWLLELTGEDITRCPQCGARPLRRIEFPPLRVMAPLRSNLHTSPEPDIFDSS